MTGLVPSNNSLDKPLGLGIMLSVHDLGSAAIQQFAVNFGGFANRVATTAKRITNTLLDLGKGFLIFKAGSSILSSSFALANRAGEFEQKLAAVGAVTRASALEMENLNQAAIQAGIATQFSPTEAVEGLTSLATAGQTARQAIQTLTPVLDLAAGSLGQLGVAESAEAVVGTLNAYGKSASEAGIVTDKLLRITQLTNFQARDFAIGLSKAAAFGSQYGQSLNDVLIVMGQLRNANIDASSSATGVRESLARIGSVPRAWKELKKAGVEIFDKTTGRMRSFIDIMYDYAEGAKNLTVEERERGKALIFGRRGMLAYNAVQQASFTTMRDGVEITFKGAEAIRELRKQMENTAGTAQEFREKLLDTFQGQKTLLQGTLQTLGVVAGKSFAQVFKPIVSVVVDALNRLIKVIKAIPEPVRASISWFLTLSGTFLAITGAVIALKAAFVLLRMALGKLNIGLAALAKSALPVLLVITAISVAIGAFKLAYEKNLGGFGDFIDKARSELSLFKQGLSELRSKGSFSAGIAADLDKESNRFLIPIIVNVSKFIDKVKEAFAGFGEGFRAAIKKYKPVFDDFKNALFSLGSAVKSVFTQMGSNVGGNFASVKGVLSAIGGFIGWLGSVFVSVITVLTRIWGGFMEGFSEGSVIMGPALKWIRNSLGSILESITELVGLEAGKEIAKNTSIFYQLGRVLGWVGAGLAGLISYAVGAIAQLASVVVYIGSSILGVLGRVGGFIFDIFSSIIEKLSDFIYGIKIGFAVLRIGFSIFKSFLLFVYTAVLEKFRMVTDGISSVFSKVVAMFKRLRNMFNDIADAITEKVTQVPVLGGLIEMRSSSIASTISETKNVHSGEIKSVAMPAAVAAQNQRGEMSQIQSVLAELVAERTTKKEIQPINIKLEVDGETLATATHKANQDAAGRAFSPIPIF